MTNKNWTVSYGVTEKKKKKKKHNIQITWEKYIFILRVTNSMREGDI